MFQAIRRFLTDFDNNNPWHYAAAVAILAALQCGLLLFVKP